MTTLELDQISVKTLSNKIINTFKAHFDKTRGEITNNTYLMEMAVSMAAMKLTINQIEKMLESQGYVTEIKIIEMDTNKH